MQRCSGASPPVPGRPTDRPRRPAGSSVPHGCASAGHTHTACARPPADPHPRSPWSLAIALPLQRVKPPHDIVLLISIVIEPGMDFVEKTAVYFELRFNHPQAQIVLIHTLKEGLRK